jgi:phenylpyruvate tautomerase PptA (4-oxalocrotonate tautomerase family)
VRFGLVIGRPLPIYPDKQIFTEAVGGASGFPDACHYGCNVIAPNRNQNATSLYDNHHRIAPLLLCNDIAEQENAMPLWKVYHPVGAFTTEEKHAFAQRITELYARLPKFYVNVIFQEVPQDSFYIGGEPVNNFVRVSIEHIARVLSVDRKAWWMERTNKAIAPLVKERGFNWELHIDETPFELWSVQGYQPPPADSEDEKRWKQENKPSPLTHA